MSFGVEYEEEGRRKGYRVEGEEEKEKKKRKENEKNGKRNKRLKNRV